MLHSINLLPWREAQKRAYRQRFVYLLFLASVMSFSLQWLASWYLDYQFQVQQQRITFLNQHIAELDQQVLSLTQAEQQHQDVTDRLATVEALQAKRNKTTQLMDLVPQLIPEGVYIDQMTMNGHSIVISGISDGTARLATMLNLLENSPLVTELEMHSIVSGSYRFNKQFQSFEVSFLFDEPKTSVRETANG